MTPRTWHGTVVDNSRREGLLGFRVDKGIKGQAVILFQKWHWSPNKLTWLDPDCAVFLESSNE